jgi:hypothetical protein
LLSCLKPVAIIGVGAAPAASSQLGIPSLSSVILGRCHCHCPCHCPATATSSGVFACRAPGWATSPWHPTLRDQPTPYLVRWRQRRGHGPGAPGQFGHILIPASQDDTSSCTSVGHGPSVPYEGPWTRRVPGYSASARTQSRHASLGWSFSCLY